MVSCYCVYNKKPEREISGFANSSVYFFIYGLSESSLNILIEHHDKKDIKRLVREKNTVDTSEGKLTYSKKKYADIAKKIDDIKRAMEQNTINFLSCSL